MHFQYPPRPSGTPPVRGSNSLNISEISLKERVLSPSIGEMPPRLGGDRGVLQAKQNLLDYRCRPALAGTEGGERVKCLTCNHI
jgi:hypothetical protein